MILMAEKSKFRGHLQREVEKEKTFLVQMKVSLYHPSTKCQYHAAASKPKWCFDVK